MPLTSDQTRTIARLAPRVLADFADLFPPPILPKVSAFEYAIRRAVERQGVAVVAKVGAVRSFEYFTLDGNVEGVRVAGPERVKFYRLLAN